MVPVQTVMWGLLTQEQRVLGPLLLLPCIGLGALASTLVREDFEHRIQERRSLFEPLHAQLSFLGDGTLRVLVAKEFVDLRLTGALQKMTLSFTVPLLVLLGLAWLAEFAEWPIPVNLLSYAPFLGFFGFNFYSWLTGIDAPDHMNGLPVTVPRTIRAKVVVYFLSTTWISIAFLVLMAWQLDAWQALPVALIVMIANSIYIVALTRSSWDCGRTRPSSTHRSWSGSGSGRSSRSLDCSCSHSRKGIRRSTRTGTIRSGRVASTRPRRCWRMT